MPTPAFSVIIPALNEEMNIGSVIDSLCLDQNPDMIEIIVSDGGSTDRTLAIVREKSALDPRVRLVNNVKRIQSAGINKAVRETDSRSTVIIRVDAHSSYPLCFASAVFRQMVERDVDSIVVRLNTIGRTCFSHAIAYASNRVIGSGGAPHRSGTRSGYVQHGHHAGIKKRSFMELGGYNETFPANEDAEFDFRLTQSGGRIWFAADIVVGYFPRNSLFGLTAQYFKYGRGRAQNNLLHKTWPAPRQLIPALFALYVITIPSITPFFSTYIIPVLIYISIVCAQAMTALLANRSVCALWIVPAVSAMHLSWGFGFLFQLLRAAFSRQN